MRLKTTNSIVGGVLVVEVNQSEMGYGISPQGVCLTECYMDRIGFPHVQIIVFRVEVNNILLLCGVDPDAVCACTVGEEGYQMTCGVCDGDVDCVVVDELPCVVIFGGELDGECSTVCEVEVIGGCDGREEGDVVYFKCCCGIVDPCLVDVASGINGAGADGVAGFGGEAGCVV